MFYVSFYALTELLFIGHTMKKQWSCLKKEIMHGWTTSRRGQDSPWKSQLERQRTEINGESTSMVWPTLVSRTAKEQNSYRIIRGQADCKLTRQEK